MALETAYGSALKVLERDAAILDQLRSRANILLAALAIGVTALGAILASPSLNLHLPAWFVVSAVVFLGSAILCCVGVLWPTRDHGDMAPLPAPVNLPPPSQPPAATPAREMLVPLTVLSPGPSAGTTASLSLSMARSQTAGHRRSAGRLADAWQRFTKPWREWYQALGHDRRLWKTVLGKEDFDDVPPQGGKNDVYPVLLEIMYLAHTRDYGTLSRRADLLRLASLLVLAFVIAFSIWLASTTSTASPRHQSVSATAVGVRPSRNNGAKSTGTV